MLEFEEQRLKLRGFADELADLKEALSYESVKVKIAELEAVTAKEDFWGDLENSQKVLQQISQLKNIVANYDRLSSSLEDTLSQIDMSDEELELSLLD